MEQKKKRDSHPGKKPTVFSTWGREGHPPLNTFTQFTLPNKHFQYPGRRDAIFTSSISKKSQDRFFFPIVPAMPLGPLGLVLCSENAVTIVDFCSVLLAVKVVRDQERVNTQV